MRLLAALLSWLVATAMLAVTVPMAWAQRNLADTGGFTALAQRVAGDPAVRDAVAGELTARAVQLIRRGGSDVDPASVRAVAAAYTAGPSFPRGFAQVTGAVHGWMFSGGSSGEWTVDLAPMLNDPEFQALLADYHVQVPTTLTVPLAPASQTLPSGQLRPLAVWALWASLAAGLITAVAALSTLVAARRRGRALTGLGVSALLAGAGGWAGIEVARRYLDDLFDGTLDASGVHIRRVADAVLAQVVQSLHGWLNLTLAAGAALVAVGVLVALLGGLWKA